MPVLKLDVDQATYERLVAEAVAQRRPIAWQAEIALQRALQRRRRDAAPAAQPAPLGGAAERPPAAPVEAAGRAT